jgi:MoxR-like ATPase
MVPARGGGMTWEDGKLTRAMRIPRCVVLIDEPTLLRSGTLSVLQTALDKRTVWLASGEVVRAAPGVFFIAADNTNGTGDDSGRYVDTAAVNAAFLDRFALKTEVSFLSPALEAGMISRRAGVPLAAAKIMVDYAGTTRSNADSGKLTMGVTTRRLLAWAQTTRNGVQSARAFNSTIVSGAASEDKATLEMLEGTTLRSLHSTIDGIIRGTVDPNAPGPVDPKAQGLVNDTLNFPDDNDTL